MAFYLWKGEKAKGQWMDATIIGLEIEGGEEVYALEFLMARLINVCQHE